MNTGSGVRESRVLRKSVGGTLGADVSSQDCASMKKREAAENFRAFLSILREWVDEERKERARRVVESASSEE